MSTSEPEILKSNVGTTDVVPSVSVENMVRIRASVMERFERAVELIREARASAQAGNLGVLDVRLRLAGGTICPFDDQEVLEAARRQIDSAAWGYLMNESGLRTFMDATARRQWDEQIYKGDIPPLTTETVAATFRLMYETRGDMFERGVIACFRNLSWDYRTNQPFAFGQRIILKNLFSPYRSGKDRWLTLNRPVVDELDDLVRVFFVLDGKVQPDYRQGMFCELSERQRFPGQFWVGDYFCIRWFLKGSAHVTFKRQDLVDRMNDILAKHYPGALAADRH